MASREELRELLESFCLPLGLPGREEEIRRALSDWLEGRVRELGVDRMGNLQARLGPRDAPRIMLDAHMDETGFMVKCVRPDGMVGVTPLGGVDPRLLPGSAVLLQPRPGRRLRGVVGLAPPHVEDPARREKVVPWDEILVDLGLGSEEEASRAGVEVGTPGVLDAGLGPLGKDAFRARNLDDRAGCVVLLALVQELAGRELPVELVLNFAVAEEVGLRGAATAAFDLKPRLALVVEATVGDSPGLEPSRQPSRLGGGPAVTVADKRIVVPRRLVRSLEDAAQRAGVPCQRKLPGSGGTDAGAIHLSRGGVPTCVVSVPTRYIHSPVSLLHLQDLAHTVALVRAWLEGVEELL